MYDAMNEPHEFVADAREEAIDKACKFFGVERDALSIAEFESGAVYGLAGRAVVVASVKGRTRPSGGPERGRGRGDGREGRDGNRRGERSRRERGGRGERGEREPRRSREAQAPLELPSEPSVGTAEGELGEVGNFLLGAIERMDLGPFTIGESEDGDVLAVEVTGAAAEQLASGDGRAVDALQLLANQVSARTGPESQRVVVDVEGDAEAREALLSSLAERVARRARDSGRAVRLDPMNPADRRLIHLALRDVDDIATMSTGEGRYRQVVVVPEGAPDFEKARREAEAAARRTEP